MDITRFLSRSKDLIDRFLSKILVEFPFEIVKKKPHTANVNIFYAKLYNSNVNIAALILMSTSE